MKLSILDPSPVAPNREVDEALQASLKLAQLAERYGYTRFWLTEHHGMEGLASSAPEILLAFIGTQTKKIRLGSGAILLPHYKPYKVAEVFHTLATLFPGRIDLGIGRAPGGGAEVTMALNDHFMQKVYEMPDRLEELLHFLTNDFSDDHPFSKLKVSPYPKIPADPWLLGTSEKSAKLAAQNGMAYAFGQFMSDEDGASIINTYQNSFQPKGNLQKPMALITVNVICAESTEAAKDLVLRYGLWQFLREREQNVLFPTKKEFSSYAFNEKEQAKIDQILDQTIYGDPEEVIRDLKQLALQIPVTEIMIHTFAPSIEERMKSYQLIGQEFFNLNEHQV